MEDLEQLRDSVTIFKVMHSNVLVLKHLVDFIGEQHKIFTLRTNVFPSSMFETWQSTAATIVVHVCSKCSHNA